MTFRAALTTVALLASPDWGHAQYIGARPLADTPRVSTPSLIDLRADSVGRRYPTDPARVADAPNGPWSFQLFVENDSRGEGTDEYYTNGLRLAWARSLWAPGWGAWAARRLPTCTEASTQDDTCYLQSTSIVLGQNMYSPRDIAAEQLIIGDRPYGGWLYAGMAARAASVRTLHGLEVDIGVTGPLSLAGPTQRMWHRIVGAQRPNGWNHQVGNHLAVAAIYDWKHRIAQAIHWRGDADESGIRWFDLIPHAGATAGNVFTYANAGATARIGFNLSADWGPDYIRPAVPQTASTPSDVGSPRPSAPKRHWFEWYLFAHTEGRLVARNIFIDENHETHRIDRRPAVADYSWGTVVRACHVTVSYRRMNRSREYKPADVTHHYDALSIALSPRCR